jgi:hypothetical protein
LQYLLQKLEAFHLKHYLKKTILTNANLKDVAENNMSIYKERKILNVLDIAGNNVFLTVTIPLVWICIKQFYGF